jgi:hypothetical protein
MSHPGGGGGGLGYKNNITVVPGNSYTVVVGICAGAPSSSSNATSVSRGGFGGGASGAVRIVWPGATRQFPSTNVSTLY